MRESNKQRVWRRIRRSRRRFFLFCCCCCCTILRSNFVHDRQREGGGDSLRHSGYETHETWRNVNVEHKGFFNFLSPGCCCCCDCFLVGSQRLISGRRSRQGKKKKLIIRWEGGGQGGRNV
jgi:hypothetical protein